jgi:AraC-like DNA-binding protein
VRPPARGPPARGAVAIRGACPAELTGLTCKGADVLGSAIGPLRERLHGLPSWPERFRAVEEFLQARAAAAEHREAPRPEVASAWRLLAGSRGTGSGHALARRTAMSSRQLSTLFDRELGVAPKALAAPMRSTTPSPTSAPRSARAATAARRDRRRVPAGRAGPAGDEHVHRSGSAYLVPWLP